jgi:polysaccharide biosynthesis/export protein
MPRFAPVLLTLIGFVSSSTAVAQVPTPEQLELLQSMSPEDRSALLQQLGLGGGASSLLDGGSGQGTRRRTGLPQETPLPFDSEGEIDPATGEVKVKTLRPGDTLIIEIDFKQDQPARVETPTPGGAPVTIVGELAPELRTDEKEVLQRVIDQVRAHNPYMLDANGALHLTGFEEIYLGGLDELQAAQRLLAIDMLRKLDIKIMRLPLLKTGPDRLKPYGYDLFRYSVSTFAPVTDVPVPSDYIVGAGDQLNIQLYGNQNRNLRLIVNRDGRVSVPGIGPVNVAGRTFDAVRSDLEKRISAQMIGVQASVAMGDTRSIRVFVMGEARRPGSYTISGLGTITSALYAAGGVKNIGSLRNVQLKRQGAVVRRLDLYDLLLRGDTSDDAKLLPGDVIFIPPVAATVTIDGEVNRPAIYELNGETSIADFVKLAGGPTPEADVSRVALVRINAERAREVVNVPLTTAEGRSTFVRNGDSIRVLRLKPTLDFGVTIEGYVHRPGPVAWHEGLRLVDVIPSVDELRPNADIHYVLVRRESGPDRWISTVSADLASALRDPTSKENIVLKPRDRIFVFDSLSGRRHSLLPLLEELKGQATITQPQALVRIDGRIAASGEYPLEENMRISDLLRAGGGLRDSAYGGTAELTRYRLDSQMRQTELIEIDLAAVLRGDESADIPLRPYDFLNVKELPEWSEQEQVILLGEVRFPGRYPIKRGETLRSVIGRAGGLTSLAFPSGSVFMRVELEKREQEQLDRLAERLQSDLAAMALQGAQANQGQASQALTVGQSLLSQLKSAKPVGRLVIDINRAMAAAPGSDQDIVLHDGDKLTIPKQKQEVTVIGEVQNSTSHFYRENLTRDDYLNLSGGLTRKADRGRIYVVRADGSVISSEGSGWFRRSGQVAMRPGDTIVAPLDTERMPALPLWGAVTQIIYNLAIAAAAVNSF